jgi:sugar fermentation stimulation protein A
LLRRYKRFLADVETASGALVTVHCPNTGAMTGCAEPGSQAWISTSPNDKRKYPHTLELVQTPDGIVSVNTGRANALVREAIEGCVLGALGALDELRSEVAIPGGGGRFDLGARSDGLAVFIEVKSATLHLGDGEGAFPDAVSERAVKHVQALRTQVAAGARGVLVFCAQHCGIDRVRAAHEIHAGYAEALGAAMQAGVEVFALGCRTDGQEFVADRPIDFMR